ncbi:MAG TPA: glycoside hydrolase family 16 protein [Anaerolineales bacterium]|nr:glycoside hydrolase family 16 protein [Anaerolineales bacterium]
MKPFLLFVLGVFLLASCAPSTSTPVLDASSSSIDEPSQILFDDFSYSTQEEMIANGWVIRSGSGWPGVPGATFRPDNVSFVDYPDQADNRLLRMTSSTDGTGENTFQTQICHQRKYLEGTYAARVRFSDTPISGVDGDQVVQTFYTITPYEEPLKPDYSELDYEYLPNGGWGSGPTTFYVTTWETVQIEPWNADNTSTPIQGSLGGWHTLVTQVAGGNVRYFVDGNLIAQHGGKYYPDALMSINFNLWFIDGGLVQAEGVRQYEEDVDWVFHEAGVMLMPDEVNAKVTGLRAAAVKFQDTVLSGIQASPCDL